VVAVGESGNPDESGGLAVNVVPFPRARLNAFRYDARSEAPPETGMCRAMPQIIAWKCPKSGRVFESYPDYRLHLRAMAEKRMVRRRMAQFADGILSDLWRSTTFGEIEEWLVAKGSLLAVRAHYLDGKNGPADFRIVKAQFQHMLWRDRCSNAHDAPRNRKTNWSGLRADLPIGYPGWIGRLWFQYKGDYGRDFFRGTGLCTGSGGGNGNACGYEVTLFEDDWTNLAVMARLAKEC